MLDARTLKEAVVQGRVIWRRHALERMLSRGITRANVVDVLLKGEQIEDYPTAFPFPSGLFAGSVGTRVVHVVAACDAESRTTCIISAYEPDSQHFEPDMTTRRRRQ